MTIMIEEKYKKLTEIEHVLLRPGRYLGSINTHTANTWVLENDTFIEKEISWNPAFQKMFDEIISNSIDFSKKPEGKHLDIIKVSCDMSTGNISVYDNGGIVVHKHSEYQQYIPEMIFELRSGSNFDDDADSTSTGQNGEGAALTAIFSKEFHVKTCDGKLIFEQSHLENSHKKSEPIIKKGNKNGTTITYLADFERLSMTGISEGDYQKLMKRCYDAAACNPHLKIYFNEQQIKIKNFEQYVKMYTNNYVYDDNQDWQVAVADTNNGFTHISFVNSTETLIGGEHITYIKDQVVSKLREVIKKKYKVDLKPSDIANHLRLFINAKIYNPRYSSQTKDELITEIKNFGTTFEVTDKFITKILKTEIIQKILDWVEARNKALEREELRKLNKNIEKTNPKLVEKFCDATSKNRYETMLFLAEGDAAVNGLKSGRDTQTMGIFPLRGKPVNVYELSPTEVLNNKEVKNVLTITNLQIGVNPYEPEGKWYIIEVNKQNYIVNENDMYICLDKKYEIEKCKIVNNNYKITKDEYENYKKQIFNSIIMRKNKLYFNKIVFASDQDSDGHHITMLLTNMFYKFWPELFEHGACLKLNTPLAKVKTKKQILEFYDMQSLTEFCNTTTDKYEVSYRKGLGTSSSDEWKEYLSVNKLQQNLVKFEIKNKKVDGDDLFKLLFSQQKGMSDLRKEWLNIE